MSKSSIFAFYKLVVAGHLTGEELKYPLQDKENIDYLYKNLYKSIVIEGEIDGKNLTFNKKLENFFS
ncbi:hypothetical protein ABK905_05670 [Acerihabitans sp. KWT182]|uniref:Uncharacterized protein n=1 Tax=Acerihabitans sp. KWT182 TaxID=3157919 RepID=A0AAU7QCE5_9GAMM